VCKAQHKKAADFLYVKADGTYVGTVSFRAAFLKLWSADHKLSSGSALVVLLD